MAIAEGLTNFGISLGAGIVIEGKKLFISNEVEKQINKAFEESLNEFCKKNAVARESDRKKINEIFNEAAQLPSRDLRSKEISGNYSRFFAIFEAKLTKQDAAYRYLKEIRDETRYLEILSEFRTAIETLREELKNTNLNELGLEYKRQIEQYKSNLESFKPRTAYANLIALEKSFENYDFTPTKLMVSSLEVLKAHCLEYMTSDHKNEWQKAYIRAYKLNKNSRENLENACYAYFRLDEFEEAEKLADQLLELDEYNPRAWAVKCLLKENDKLCDVLEEVPKPVIDDLKFKAIIHVRSIGKESYIDLREAFEKYEILVDVIDFDGKITTFDNFKERAYLMNCAGTQVLKFYINFNERVIIPADILKPIFELQKSYIEAIDNSEFEEDRNPIRFLNAYVDFLMTGSKDSVYKMKNYYTDSESKQSYHTILLANSLQLISDLKDAIEIINTSPEQTSELLALKVMCYSKLEDPDNFIITAKLFLAGLTDIGTHHLIHVFAIIETLNDLNLNHRISIEEYIQGKNYPSMTIQNLVVEVLKVYNGEINTAKELDQIWQTGLISEGYMKSSLANAFLLLEEFSKSIEVYKTFIQFDRESLDLLRYIQALFSSKKNNSELLKVLRIWREKFSFHPKILQLEIDLRRQLFEWDEIITICDQYILKDESDEFVLANFAIAINEIDNPSKEQFERLIKLVSKIDFVSYTNARAVAQVLMQNGYHIESLEINYKQAIKESNSLARMDYFMACVHCPEGTLKNYETVEEGHFVKYKNMGCTSFVEVSSKNEKFKKLIGKKVGDQVTYSGAISQSDKAIEIIRIMNKYLCLHDQILEEVDNKDPFSQMPMESFNVKEYIENGNILDFFAEIAGKQDYDPEKLFNEYYSGKLSYTEIVAAEFSKHFIRAYYNLEYDRSGIIQMPPTAYPEINLPEYNYFILDFTSLLRLFELSRNKNLKFNFKFIITSSTKSMIKSFSKDLIGHSGNQYHLDKKYYEDLLGWIELNCEAKMATSKLDLISSIPVEARGNPVQELLLDIVTLTSELEKSILITDDLIMFKFFPINSGKIIGTTTFNLKALIHGLAS